MNRASYNSPRRQQAAAATREAIIEAAQELFACQGYARTTVAQVAEAAQVAANTVYTSVGGKPQLLAAITEGGTGDPDVAETLTAVAQATDPAEVIRLTAAGTRRVNQRPAETVAVLLDSAQADPPGPRCCRPPPLPRRPRHLGPATGGPGRGRAARPEPGRRRLLVPVRLDVLADPHHRPRLELGRGRAVAGAARHRRTAQPARPRPGPCCSSPRHGKNRDRRADDAGCSFEVADGRYAIRSTVLPDSNAFGWVTLPPERFTLHVPAEVRISSQPGCAALTREAGSRKLSFRITLTSRRFLDAAVMGGRANPDAQDRAQCAESSLAPAGVVARAAASLDLLSGGRVVLRAEQLPVSCAFRIGAWPGPLPAGRRPGGPVSKFVAGRCLPTEPSLRCAAQKEQE